MKIILNKILPFGTYYAVNLFGIVLSKRTLTCEERNHEYIHTLQQREMLFIGFYLWYFIEWLIRLVATRSLNRAYANISFEREAYRHQHDQGYSSHRPLFAWKKFLRQMPGH